MLPGVCIVCRNPVAWNGIAWADPDGRWHYCPKERPTCGAWMPRAQERCARVPGHSLGRWPSDGHRSRPVMDNDLAMRTGRRVA